MYTTPKIVASVDISAALSDVLGQTCSNPTGGPCAE